jgi:PAS domain S-box-containing protein
MRNVNERKWTEAAVRESEKRFRGALEIDTVGIIFFDLEGNITDANDAFLCMSGYTREDLAGGPLRWDKLTPPEWMPASIRTRDQLSATGRATPYEKQYIRKDGSLWWGLFAPRMLNEREAVEFILDITERKRTEEALRASEARFRGLVNATSNALYSMSPDWSEMRQLGGGGFIQDTESPDVNWLHKYIHPDDQPRVLDAIQQAIQTKSVFELEHRVLRVDGTLGWTHSRAVPLLDASGEITEWFGAASDVTARKATEQERERLVVELARSNEDLSQFARVASHDLRAPLNTIVQFSKLLLNRYKGKILDESAEEFLDLIIGSAQRMTLLVSDLLRYAKLSSSPLLPATAVSTGSMVKAALANLQSEIQETGAAVICDALPDVNLEGTLLVQLFQNLIGNAIKYRGNNASRIHIAAEEQGGYHLFSVKDNGIGFEEHHHERIFEPFKRLHGAGIPGTGIGLAICKKIIERAGGRIWVESEPGRGSCFYFTLPR